MSDRRPTRGPGRRPQRTPLDPARRAAFDVLRAVSELGYKGYVGLECWPKDGEEKAIERLIATDTW